MTVPYLISKKGQRRGELTSVKPQIIKSLGRETSPLWRAGDGGEERVEKDGLKEREERRTEGGKKKFNIFLI